MAKNNRERIDEGLQLLRQALAPYVGREMQVIFRDQWLGKVRQAFADKGHYQFSETMEEWDLQALLAVMTKFWRETFARTLGNAERNWIGEIWEVRNRHAHVSAKSAFSYQDTFRALDTMARLSESVSAPETESLRRLANETQRIQFDEQSRNERRKAQRVMVEGQPSASLKPWREIVSPHKDVAGGNYQRAEFAADLWRVYQNPEECSPEYGDPVEFFRRTYITAGLRILLASALERLSGKGGDPVTQLQTNFGGGKTHSMLALYHLCAGRPLNTLPGLEEILGETDIAALPKVSRVVLVGTRISPGDPLVKEDRTQVRTLWGEIAWQLGGKEAYETIRKADETATNPNDSTLKELFEKYGPVLILIDEWVAYARQLHDEADLPGGSFDTQFTFAQALTEIVSSVPNALMIVSLPASDTGDDEPKTSSDSVEMAEVGGERGKEALRRLRHVVGRKDSPWRSASQEESFEIVRRRLFNPIENPDLYRQRDAVVRSYYDMYTSQPAEFPGVTRQTDYEARMKAAYPVHPELFDRLYTDWGSLVRFQRTRGVLRLMAAVVHSLWEGNDRSPLIMPGHVPVGDDAVEREMTRYLDDNWEPVIAKDVDGPHSLPLEIDRSNNNLGRYSASRRVARAVYIGSAPTLKAASKGIDEQRIKLGCVQPGETVAIFGDALKKLTTQATFLYDDGGRYWFATTPSLNRLAEDEAERLKQKEDRVHAEIVSRLEKNLGLDRDVFAKIHIAPSSAHDVLDDVSARLVVLGADHPHQRNEESPALVLAKEILDKRGNGPRLYPNTLFFLAADLQALDSLSHAVRQYLAWQSISERDEEELDITAAGKRQIQARIKEYDQAVASRVSETWRWLLVPGKELRSPETTWRPVRLQGDGSLAGRAGKKLLADADLLERMGPAILRREVDKVPLWRGDHVAIPELIEDFAKYLYLPSVTGPKTIVNAVSEGVALSSWEIDGFAYADRYDEETKRYEGLKVGSLPALGEMDRGLIVSPEAAKAQFAKEAESRSSDTAQGKPGEGKPGDPVKSGPGKGSGAAEVKKPTSFHLTATVPATKLLPEAKKLSDEVLQHLAAKLGSKVEVTIDVSALLEDGYDEDTIRVVMENCRALGMEHFGFEEE